MMASSSAPAMCPLTETTSQPADRRSTSQAPARRSNEWPQHDSIHGIEGSVKCRSDNEKFRLGATRRNVGMGNVTVEEDTIALLEPLGGPALEMDFHGSLENVEEFLARMRSHATVLFDGAREQRHLDRPDPCRCEIRVKRRIKNIWQLRIVTRPAPSDTDRTTSPTSRVATQNVIRM